MSFMNPVDMVEEDAADLQFPKDVSTKIAQANEAQPKTGTTRAHSSLKSSEDVITIEPTAATKYKTVLCDPQVLAKAAEEIANKKSSDIDCSDCCETCSEELQEPYIKCADCHVLLCVQCFARGRETATHSNTHSYIIIRDDIQVFPEAGTWTAREERILLATLQESGCDNWEAVAKALHWKRTPDECRQHYHSCYFGGIFERLLGLTRASETYFPERMPYIMKMRSVDPPRTDDFSSMQFKIMGGYRCARGDFDTPYDASAESLLTIAMDDDLSTWEDEASRKVVAELQCALVRAYNRRLKERERRYRIMRDHGLIMPNRTLGWISRYAEAFGSEANCTRFLTFMQVCDPIEFDKLVESIKYFSDLRKSIFRLYELRKNGVRTLAGGARYFKEKRKRLLAQRERSKNLKYDWRKLVPNPHSVQAGDSSALAASSMPVSARKKAAPMEIIGLPGYAKLDDAERQLCSVARIYPQNYMDYKNLLKVENAKIGQLRLADARRLIKIDVNKTRQIYDFLVEHGHINKPT